MSIFPYEGILDEIKKVQGDSPSLVVLYKSPQDVILLADGITFNSPEMDLILKHLTIEVFRAKGVHIDVIGKRSN